MGNFEKDAKKVVDEARNDLGAASVDAQGFFAKHKAVTIVAGLVILGVIVFFMVF